MSGNYRMHINYLIGFIFVLCFSCQQRNELTEFFKEFVEQIPFESFEENIKKQNEFKFDVHFRVFKGELIRYTKDPEIEKKFQSLDIYKYHKESYFYEMLYIAFIRYLNNDKINVENIVLALKEYEEK